MTYKILFVCLGNICRSPAAENIMNHLVAQAGLGDAIACDSAGTSSYHVGNAPDRRMSAAAQKRGIPMRGQARQFVREDFDQFDLIVAMDRDNYSNILYLDPGQEHRDRVKMMCEFASNHPDKDVPDPYYGGDAGFDYVIDLLDDACSGLLTQIRRDEGLSL
jgi:protein-tyrosine phosphatase